MTDAPHEVTPLLHLRIPEGHKLFEIGVDWPSGLTLAELERRVADRGWLPLPDERVDRLIVRIGIGSGLWRFSARPDWRRSRLIHALNAGPGHQADRPADLSALSIDSHRARTERLESEE